MLVLPKAQVVIPENPRVGAAFHRFGFIMWIVYLPFPSVTKIFYGVSHVEQNL